MGEPGAGAYAAAGALVRRLHTTQQLLARNATHNHLQCRDVGKRGRTSTGCTHSSSDGYCAGVLSGGRGRCLSSQGAVPRAGPRELGTRTSKKDTHAGRRHRQTCSDWVHVSRVPTTSAPNLYHWCQFLFQLQKQGAARARAERAGGACQEATGNLKALNNW